AGALVGDGRGRVLHRERSFFGVHRVAHDPAGQFVQLYHGTTLHGQQHLDPQRRREALTYFHRSGPVGQVFTAFAGPAAPKRVAVIGLGVGTLVAYAESGQEWTYYEIDPAVEVIARSHFTFLDDAGRRGAGLRVVPGDGRLQLARDAADGAYDLFVLDAFSSD